ncbi:hypothetical protein D3C72_1066700 [compost metagenome]
MNERDQFEIHIQNNPFDLFMTDPSTPQHSVPHTKVLRYDPKASSLLDDIRLKIDTIISNGYKPAYILMNSRNYERLVAYNYSRSNGSIALFEIEGLRVIVWDVPVDYVNVVSDPHTEWLYGKQIRK